MNYRKPHKLRPGLYELQYGEHRIILHLRGMRYGEGEWVWRMTGGRFTESVRCKSGSETKNECLAEAKHFADHATQDSYGKWRVEEPANFW